VVAVEEVVGPDIREYRAEARSTGLLGRALVSARDQHLVVDGPVYNGCPGEAITPGELFLSAVAACGVELVEVIAKEEGVGVTKVGATVDGVVDRSHPVREDLTVFSSVRLRFEVGGVSDEEATSLIEAFTRRCPLYGTVAAATPQVSVDVEVVP
jgi:uncharacterized OsmC-like protein